MGTRWPRDVVASIRRARRSLQAGHVVCIFAEGAISRTGNLLPFKRGLERIVEGLDVPIIPVHLDRLWGSIFSFEGGRFFWKWPKRIPYPVTVSFGNSDAGHLHRAGSPAGHPGTRRATRWRSQGAAIRLTARFIRTARKNWSKFAMADSTRPRTDLRTRADGQPPGRELGAQEPPDEKMVGLLLPPSVARRAGEHWRHDGRQSPVNLNFTAGARP